mmetsp:Transcript_12937/g.44765  ORF Transcript_12937/g.44765 Transcript_12937/m.44765 type:complete len:210 (+) Transcript_12937:839-1468(+)
MSFCYFHLLRLRGVRLLGGGELEEKVADKVVGPLLAEVRREEAVGGVALGVEVVVDALRLARRIRVARVDGRVSDDVDVRGEVVLKRRLQRGLDALAAGLLEARVQHLFREIAVVVVPAARDGAAQLVAALHGAHGGEGGRGVRRPVGLLVAAAEGLGVHDAEQLLVAKGQEVDAQQRRVDAVKVRIPERVEDLERGPAVEVRHAHPSK